MKSTNIRLSVLIALVLLLTSLPMGSVFAAENNKVEMMVPEEVDSIEEEKSLVSATPAINTTDVVSPVQVLAVEDFTGGDACLSSVVDRFYEQPEFYPVGGYDVLSFYITGEDGTYIGRCYYVLYKAAVSQNWLLYNYSQDAANTYLEKSEVFNDLYLPTKKADSRTDDPLTPEIDESKIPTMSREAFNGIYCNWRSFEDIPFTRDDDDELVYATWKEITNDDPDDDPDDDDDDDDDPAKKEPTTTSTNAWYKYTVSLNSGNTYRIYITRSVSYNGRKHVLVGSKSGKKKSADIQLRVFLNGEFVAPVFYKAVFEDNKYVNGYGTGQSIPYVRLRFKFKNRVLRADKRELKRKAFGFNITPISLKSGNILTRVKVTKYGVNLVKPVFTTKDGNIIKMERQRFSPFTGDYVLSYDDGAIIIKGVNNFKDSVKLDYSPIDKDGESPIY